MYASTDNGQTWPMSLYTVGSNDNIFSILEQNNNQTVYIGTRNGVLKSTNGGTNFISINNGIPANSWVRDLESDSLGNLAAATTNGLFTSTNAGSNWQLISGIPPTDTIIKLYTVYSQIFDGKIDSYILSGTNNKRIYLAQYQNAVPIAFAPSPNPEEIVNFSAKVYAFNDNIKYELFVWTHGGGFYSTIDRGFTWVQLNNGLPQNPLISTGTNIKLDLNANGNTIKFFCGLNENSLNGARVFSLDYKVGIQSISTEIPDNFSLEQNYPNPFNPETKIKFSVREKSLVSIKVFDALGKELDELVNEELAAGTYQTNFNGSGYNSGVYFYRLTTDNYTETKKMILIK
ncbi:MAG: T9SS type A sorting domain-containing protein [Ignavibacteria bacterium]|nr:T9SS type A sorting domain-containing protein [Ignavibacteria bacterium]